MPMVFPQQCFTEVCHVTGPGPAVCAFFPVPSDCTKLSLLALAWQQKRPEEFSFRLLRGDVVGKLPWGVRKVSVSLFKWNGVSGIADVFWLLRHLPLLLYLPQKHFGPLQLSFCEKPYKKTYSENAYQIRYHKWGRREKRQIWKFL